MQTEINSLKDFIDDVIRRTKPRHHKQDIPGKLSNDLINKFKEKVKAIDTEKGDSFVWDDLEQFYNYYFATTNKTFSDNINSRKIFYYRGQSDKDYKLTPGIMRDHEKHDEYYYTNNMKVRCPSELSNLNCIDRLTYLQHYGCPTRLLDVTSNPLVALYFSCCSNKTRDGCVYVFETCGDAVLYPGSDRVHMLAKLSEIKQEEKKQLLKAAYSFLIEEKFPQSSHKQYKDKVVERFYYDVKKDNPAFERKMRPIDLLSPVFVQTALNNPRILKQDGAFILCGLDKDANECSSKLKKYVCGEIVIPANSKRRIITELESVCITQASLFPEIDKVAGYLKGRA